MDSKNKPSLLFRSVVILSSVALILGVVGIFYFRSLEREAENVRPRNACVVMVQGLKTLEGVDLEASWIDTEGKEREEMGLALEAGGYWAFHRVPEGSPVKLKVLVTANDHTRTVHRQPAVLTRGGVFEIWLR